MTRKNLKVALWLCGVFVLIATLALVARPRPNFYAPKYVPFRDLTLWGTWQTEKYDPASLKPRPLGVLAAETNLALPLPIRAPDPNWAYPDLVEVREGSKVRFEFKDPAAKSTAAPEVVLPSPWFGAIFDENPAPLPDGDRLIFAAYGLRYPKAGDPPADMSREDYEKLSPPPRERFRFRAPQDGRIIPEAELDRLGVPVAMRDIETANHNFPTLRLIFRREGLPALEVMHPARVFDRLTGVQVGMSEWNEDLQTNEGDWSALDLKLTIWHDTSVAFHLDLVSGRMEEAELKLEPNAQVVLGKRVRVGMLMAVPGHPVGQTIPPFEAGDWEHELTPTGNGTAVFLRMPLHDYRAHCAVLPDQPGQNLIFFSRYQFYYHRERIGIHLPDRKLAMGGGSIRLGYFPYLTRVWFRLDRLEDMPNGPEIENLFDVRIPRISVAKNKGGFFRLGHFASSEDRLIQVVRAATEMDGSSPFFLMPFEEMGFREADLTFYDTSPRELLEFCLKHTPGASIQVDPEARRLEFQHKEPWLPRLKGWWNQVTPW